MWNRPRKLKGMFSHIIPASLKRHFTWLSASFVLLLTAIVLYLIWEFVPGVTTNSILGPVLLWGNWIFWVLAAVSSILTIQDWWRSRSPSSSSNEQNTASNQLSNRASGFVRSNEEILNEAVEDLQGAFSISEEGDILIHHSEDPLDRRGMVYVIAASVAAEAGEDVRDSHWVTHQELMDEMGYSISSANVFISKMGPFLDRDFDQVEQADEDPDPSEVRFKLNIEEVHDAVQYVNGDRASPN